MLGFPGDLRLSLLRRAVPAGVLAVAASLIAVGGAAGQPDYGLVPLDPFPVVHIVGAGTPKGAKVTKLTARGPTASAVIATCSPASRCPFKQRARLISGPAGSTRTIRLNALERHYRSGVTVRLYIVKPDFIGKYTSFGFRRDKAPRRFDRCVNGVVLKAVLCQNG